MTDYGSVSYWDFRYASAEDARYDWLQTYDMLKPILAKHLHPSSEILLLGCGNSPFAERLYQDGYTNVTCVDFSSVVISQLRARYERHMKEMDFAVMDITEKLDYPDSTFHVVFDKACLDAVLCGKDSLNKAHAAISNIYRVLKPGGAFISVSHGAPASRIPFLRAGDKDWSLEYTTVPKVPVHSEGSFQSSSQPTSIMSHQKSMSKVCYYYQCLKQPNS